MDHVISRKKAWVIIAGSAIVLLSVGSLVGYGFFWDQYDTATSSQKAATMLEEQVMIKPDDKTNQLELAWAYVDEEKFNQAKDLFNQLLKQKEYSFEAKHGLASVQMGMKQYAEAEKLLVELHKAAADNSQVVYDLGIAQREQERYADSEKTFKKGLVLDPVSADMHYELGLVYEKMKNKQEAIIHYKKSVDFVPDYTEARDGLKRLGEAGYEPKKYH